MAMSTTHHPPSLDMSNNFSKLLSTSLQQIQHKTPKMFSPEHHSSFELTWRSVILIIALIIVSLWIFVTNSLLIYAIAKKRKSAKRSTDYYFINLTLIDAFDGSIILPFMGSVVISGHFPLSYCWCQLWIFIDYILIIGASIGFMGLLLNYIWMVRRPSEYRRVTRGQHFLLVIILWGISIIIWLPAFLNNYRISYPNGICGFNININRYFTLYVGLAGMYIPLVICISSAIYSIFLLRKHVHERLFYVSNLKSKATILKKYRNSPLDLSRVWSSGAMFETNHIIQAQREARNEMPLVCTLLALFTLSRAIYYIYFGVGAFVVSIFPRDLANSVYWIIQVHGCLTPIIHFVFDSKVRESFYQNIFTCKWRKRSSGRNRPPFMLRKVSHCSIISVTSTSSTHFIRPIIMVKPIMNLNNNNTSKKSLMLSTVDVN